MTALLLGGYYSTTTESWPCDLVVPDIPVKVERAAAAVLGSTVFLCGGRRAGTDSSECSILENQAWGEGPSMVKKRAWFTLNLIGDTLIAAGGRNNIINHGSVEYYNEEQGVWELAPWSLTRKRYSHCSATLSNTEIILAGGYNDGVLSMVEKYSILTGEVVSLTDLTFPRAHHSCTLQGDSLIVSGGSSTSGTALYPVDKLNLNTLTWSSLPLLNPARLYHTMGLINGALVVFGGYPTSSTLEILNGTKWETQQLQYDRYHHAMGLLPCP